MNSNLRRGDRVLASLTRELPSPDVQHAGQFCLAVSSAETIAY